MQSLLQQVEQLKQENYELWAQIVKERCSQSHHTLLNRPTLIEVAAKCHHTKCIRKTFPLTALQLGPNRLMPQPTSPTSTRLLALVEKSKKMDNDEALACQMT